MDFGFSGRLWEKSIAVFAHTLGLSFDDVMRRNVKKLQDRQKRQVIRGAGDNR